MIPENDVSHDLLMNIFAIILLEKEERKNSLISCIITVINFHKRSLLIGWEGTLNKMLIHLSLASLLWDIGKQNSPACDAAERGVPSGAILFAERIFIEKLNEI